MLPVKCTPARSGCASTVSEIAASESYDAEDMEKKLRELGVTDNWFRHHVKVKAGYTTLEELLRIITVAEK